MKTTGTLLATLGVAGLHAVAFADPPRLIAEFKDLDGDGIVSSSETARQIAGDVQTMFEEELDGNQDGAVLRARLIKYARALFGDLDGDGDVDTDDVIVLFESAGLPAPKIEDGNLVVDTAVDGMDMIALTDALGTQLTFTDQEALNGLLALALSVPASDVYVVEKPPPRGPNGHTIAITRSWPDPPPSFPPTEFDWPPNHHGGISPSWPSNPHWPANHLGQISPMWQPELHAEALSATWPPSHSLAMTPTWPSPHTRDVSEMWPAGHLGSRSVSGDRPEHIGYISQTWPGAGHALDISSQRWPGDHLWQFSQTWVDHATETSSHWPATHHSQISELWPGQRHWPPNHVESISETWDDPRDHSVVQTIMNDPSNPFRIPANWTEWGQPETP